MSKWTVLIQTVTLGKLHKEPGASHLEILSWNNFQNQFLHHMRQEVS